MTALLEQAIERVRNLPQGTQDAFARVLLQLADDRQGIYQLTAAEEADLIEADEELERGELASEAQVRAVFQKHVR